MLRTTHDTIDTTDAAYTRGWFGLNVGRLTLIVVLLAGVGLMGGCSKGTGDSAAGPATETSGSVAPETAAAGGEFVLAQLPDYPHDVVPLHEVKLLDTVIYSVRNDPQWASVEGGLRNFYHSVYESNIPASEVLTYYRGLCDSIDEEMTMDEQLYGTIGPYDISLNTGRHNDKEMVYLSVDLPRASVAQTNRFFADYPADLVELPASFKVFEEKYVDSIMRGSEIMYERHFDVLDLDGDGNPDLQGDACLDHFQAQYGARDGFTLDRENRMATWTDGEYRVTVAFMSHFGRGVLEVGRDRVQ